MLWYDKSKIENKAIIQRKKYGNYLIFGGGNTVYEAQKNICRMADIL